MHPQSFFKGPNTSLLPVSGHSVYTQFNTHIQTHTLAHPQRTAMALKVTGYKTALIPRRLHDFEIPCSLFYFHFENI